MKAFAWVIGSLMLFGSSLAEAGFQHAFNLFDDAESVPYFSSNAFLRKENIFGPDSVRYWQPAAANTWAEIVYRVDLTGPISTATLRADLWGYQAFDSGAKAFLDVSTDFSSWTQIAEAGPGGSYPGPEYHVTDTFDISGIAQGSSVLFIRSRLFTTRYSSGGSFGVSQWLRSNREIHEPVFILNAELLAPVPEPASLGMWVTTMFGVACFRKHRRQKRKMIRFFSKNSLARIAGTWASSWKNLTTGWKGSSAGFANAELDAQDEMGFGVFHLEAGNTTSQPGDLSYLSVEPKYNPAAAPEPSSILISVSRIVAIAIQSFGFTKDGHFLRVGRKRV